MGCFDRFKVFKKYGFSVRRGSVNDSWVELIKGSLVFPFSDDLSDFFNCFELVISPVSGSEFNVLDEVLHTLAHRKDVLVRYHHKPVRNWELSNDRIVVPVKSEIHRRGYLFLLKDLDVVPDPVPPRYVQGYNDFLYFREGTLLSRIIRKDSLDDHFAGENYSLIKR